MIANSRKKQEEGFSIVEMLVAIMMTNLFLISSLQMMLASHLMRDKANQRYIASEWINRDIEKIRFEAKNLPLRDQDCGNFGEALRKVINDKEVANGKEKEKIVANGKEEALKTNYLDKVNELDVKNIILNRWMTSKRNYLELKYVAELSYANVPENKKIIKLTDVTPDAVFQCPKK